MVAWWTGLSALAQTFYAAALFFSVVFLWQLVAAVSGLGGDGDADGADDAFAGDPESDLADDVHGLDTIRLLSIRSLLAFGLLFSWAAALYLGQGISVQGVILRALFWGALGMVVVATFFWMLPRLTEEGTAQNSSAVGQVAEVYIRLPATGDGQVRVLLGDQVRFVKARSVAGVAIAAEAKVIVVDVAEDGALLVQPYE